MAHYRQLNMHWHNKLDTYGANKLCIGNRLLIQTVNNNNMMGAYEGICTFALQIGRARCNNLINEHCARMLWCIVCSWPCMMNYVNHSMLCCNHITVCHYNMSTIYCHGSSPTLCRNTHHTLRQYYHSNGQYILIVIWWTVHNYYKMKLAYDCNRHKLRSYPSAISYANAIL